MFVNADNFIPLMLHNTSELKKNGALENLTNNSHFELDKTDTTNKIVIAQLSNDLTWTNNAIIQIEI